MYTRYGADDAHYNVKVNSSEVKFIVNGNLPPTPKSPPCLHDHIRRSIDAARRSHQLRMSPTNAATFEQIFEHSPPTKTYKLHHRYSHRNKNALHDDEIRNIMQSPPDFSNRNNNDDFKLFGNAYALDPYAMAVPEYQLLPPQDEGCSNPAYEQHYQHYYSYFYDTNLSNQKYQKKLGNGRKLPSLSVMPIVTKKDNFLVENQHQVLSKTNFVDTGSYRRHQSTDRSRPTTPTNVLREKLSNNNDAFSFDDFTRYGDGSKEEQSDGSFLDGIHANEYENRNVKLAKAARMRLVLQATRRKLRTRSDSDTRDYKATNDSQWVRRDGGNDNSSDQSQRVHSPNNNEPIPPRPIKLPATPVKSKALVVVKKPSPPSPHNRRVLLYDSQSPRLARTSSSHSRVGHSKSKQQIDSRTKIKNNVQMVMGGRVLSGIGDSESSDLSSDSEESYRSYAYKITHSADCIPSVESFLEFQECGETLDNPETILVPSLFPNVPPYLAFSSDTQKGPEIPPDLYRVLKWRVTSNMPRVVRRILGNSGMRLLKKTNDWMGIWAKHMKSTSFKSIRPHQKINHLPGSFRIGRKDSCWKSLVKLKAKHGKKDFGFMPKTYIIPNDLGQLRKSWPKYAQRNVKWIIKPPAGARGTGIRVVDHWNQIPKRKPLIVQKYIERPLLINSSKFDLRLYVLVTSINPLRVYMYHNGLARFASVKYSEKSETLNDRCMHLTNYSINKKSSNYSKNEDVNACHGHKWTIKSLWNYLGNRGVRTDCLWEALRNLVLHTILAGENAINNMIKANVESKYSCYELFGFDVLLDADLVPWLLEVNISPSLHSELPLDTFVKAPLVQSILNTALYHVPPKIPMDRQLEIAAELSLPPGQICFDKRLYITYLSRQEKIKHNAFTRKSIEDRYEYINEILERLTPDDVRCLITAEDELARSKPLERIFPTAETYKYLKYTESARYYNRLLDAWETRYSENRSAGIDLLRDYCSERYHLQIPPTPAKKVNIYVLNIIIYIQTFAYI
uniref:Tubulin polyglutamylase TTLL4 n=1 Tax=Glossina pallidipes TaxID=7398 RepID=A0A1A9ZEW7_GLOPL